MSGTPLRYLAALNESVLPEDTSADFAFKYIDISQVDGNGNVSIPADEMSFAAAPSRARRLADPGSTVVSTVRTYLRAIGTVPAVDDQLVFSTGFAVLRPLKGDPRYFSYACRSDAFINEVVARSVGVSYPAISPSDLMDISLPSPNGAEQRRIADFLDNRVARIDQIITARHRQGRLATDHLASQLEALVDDYRRCAPSRRLGSMSFISSGKFLPSQDFEDDGAVRVFGGNGVAGGYRVANTKKHSLVVGRVGALCGNVHLLTEDAWVTDNALVVRLRDPEVSPAYVAAVLDAANLNSIASQTAQPLLTGTQIGDWSIPITSSSQQEQLVEVWRRKSSTAATDLFRRSIRLMSEYKQSLITAAVTGELDVTTATTTLP